MRSGKQRQESSFSEEKEAKRLLSTKLRNSLHGHRIKSFLLLFFKKEAFLS